MATRDITPSRLSRQYRQSYATTTHAEDDAHDADEDAPAVPLSASQLRAI